MLENRFSSQKIHQAAIMMLDAQKIQSFNGYESVKKLRNINKIYKNGELYVEGLAYIASISMDVLAREKNYIGKHLKVLHALYTDAVLKKQSAVLDCFRYWQPSVHINTLLQEYDLNKQKIGKNRNKILRQQKHFWDEMLKFRKEINKLKTHGLEKTILSWDMLYFCKTHGVNSLIPAYLAQQKAENLYNQTGEDKVAHAQNLQSLFAEIKPNDLNNTALFAEKFLACYAYFKKIRKNIMPQEYAEKLYDLPFVTMDKSSIATRKKLYDGMKARVSIVNLQAKSGEDNKICTLAYLYNDTADSMCIGNFHVRTMLAERNNVEQKREYVEELVKQGQEMLQQSREAMFGRVPGEAVLGMTYLLKEYGLPDNIHGVLQMDNLKNMRVSAKVVRDLKWLQNEDNSEGLDVSMYKYFEPGIVDEYCSRSAENYNQDSPNYKANNYISKDKRKTAYTRALYEFLALRHQYRKKTHCKNFPQELRLSAFRPNSDYYRQLRTLSTPSQTGSQHRDGNYK